MSLEALISNYGYIAIGLGTFLEGETVLVLGGFAAHRGYLELPGVILAAFIGTLCGDQLYFYIGRAKGKGLLDRRPNWKSKSEKVLSLLHRHQVWLILGFRFLYGIRTLTPFLIGAIGIPPARFLLFNFLGASLWAIVVGTLGYLFGHALEIVIGDIKRYELLVSSLLAGTGFLVWLSYFLKGKRSGTNKKMPLDRSKQT